MTSEIMRDVASIDPIALAALQRSMRGEVLVPGSAGYASARRIVNSRHDQYPALIARCHTAADVAQAVVFARDYGLHIAVRSGGHSVPGHSTGDGVMLIDLAPMRQIDISPARRVAQVQPGATNGELVIAAQAYGLATTTGTCATVGMGGSTLGGGIGWLMGRFGMTIDNVLAFELVTSAGEILNVSADAHAELFWALRGGGGNFGIVTSITYKLHPLGTVLGGMAIFHMAAAPLALRVYRHLTSTAPDELLAHAVLTTVPDFGPALIVQAVYSGDDLHEGERVLAPLRQFGPPAIDLIAPRPYAELYMMLTPPLPPGAAWYDTATTLRQPSDAALDMLVACANDRPGPMPAIDIHQVHGAATRIPANVTAFALREPHYAVAMVGMWLAGDGAAETAWAQQTQARLLPYASPGVYVNFLGDEGPAAVRAAYQANYARLAQIKAQYDPDNMFCRNQNIVPAARTNQ